MAFRAGPEADALERVGGEGDDVGDAGLVALKDVFGAERKFFRLRFDDDIGVLGRWATARRVKHEMALPQKDVLSHSTKYVRNCIDCKHEHESDQIKFEYSVVIAALIAKKLLRCRKIPC